MPSFESSLGIFSSKVGHIELVLGCHQGSLVGLHTQDYKSLCAVLTTCATLIDQKLDCYILHTYKHTCKFI